MVWGRTIVGLAVMLVACESDPREFTSDTGGSGGGGASSTAGSTSGAAARAGSEPGGSGGQAGGPTQPDQGGNSGEGGAGPETCGDTLSNESNCGSCGHECEAEEVCNEGACEPLPDHCKDDELNEDETDLNCGGSCVSCEVDAACEVDGDCGSGFCNAEKKCAEPRCGDTVQNGEETGLDCGGETCRALNLLCNNDEPCATDGDCKTSFCKGGVCASPTCSDNALNQGETAVDCGGPVCRLNVSPIGTCANGQACTVNEDCSSVFCNNLVCAKPTCTDGAKNQDETDKDCGGPTCRGEANGKCSDNKICAAHADCGSGFCSPGKLCSPAGCGNSAKDPNETDLDCGGDGCRATKPCALTQACVIHADCASGSCKSNKCVAPTCQDGIKNQGETATDCGGVTCATAGTKCANGQACEQNRDCTDGFCLNNTCSNACKGKPPTLGCPCSPDNTLACAGTAQSVKLICNAGSWGTNGVSCPADYNCNQGTCKLTIPACVQVGSGKSYCEAASPSTQSFLCDADLVSSSPTSCGGVCKNGVCQGVACGDGRKAASEPCDDGNTTSLDGCENDCKISRVLSLAVGNGFVCALTEGGFVRCWGANDTGQLGLGDVVYRQTDEPFELKNAAGTAPAGPIDLGGKAVAITAGVGHACAILSDGSARCWGDNANGQLGLGNIDSQTNLVPRLIGRVKVAAARKITSLSAGARHTCAVLDDGTATCWGQNASGELGLGKVTAVSATQTPEQTGAISLGANAVSIGAGSNSTCAVLVGSKIRCWGLGNNGQLGTGNYPTHGNVGDNELPNSLGDAGLVPLFPSTTVLDLKVGNAHACALLSGDQVECWGLNSSGAIGIGDPANIGDGESPAVFGGPIFASGERVTAISVGFNSTCAMVSGQGLRCWGLNKRGQAGYGNIDNLGADLGTVPSALPEVNPGGGQSIKLAVTNWNQTCAILGNDSVKCWGWNDRGQLGYGTVSSSPDYLGGPGNTPDTLAAIRIFIP